MSGSPIVDANGAAIGVLGSVSFAGGVSTASKQTPLAQALPHWLAVDLLKVKALEDVEAAANSQEAAADEVESTK